MTKKIIVKDMTEEPNNNKEPSYQDCQNCIHYESCCEVYDTPKNVIYTKKD